MRAAEAVEQLGQRQQGLATAAQLRRLVSRSGVSRATSSGQVLAVRPRVYALAPLPVARRHLVTDEGACPAWVAGVRAALLSTSGSAAAGRTAAALRGWGLLVEPHRQLDLAVPHGRGAVVARGARVRQVRDLSIEQVVAAPGHDPLPATGAVATVVACCLDLPLLEAVAVCDSALRARDVDVEQLVPAGAALPGVRDAARVRGVLAECDPAAGSVLESVLRVRLRLAGVTGFETQRVVRDLQGRHVLRADFCFPRQRLVVETDGSRYHPEPARDQEIDNALCEAGWRVLRFGWVPVVQGGDAVVRQVQASLRWDSRPPV